MASLLKNDALGKRKEKYNYLTENSLSTINWKAVEPQSPDYFFKEFKYKLRNKFEEWISLDKLFIESGTGIKFRKDNLLIKPHFDRDSVIELFKDMKNLDSQQILEKYNISDTKDWKISEKRDLFEDEADDIMEVQYRLFDSRFTYYPYEKIHEIIVRGDSRRELMRNLFFEDNLALLSARQQSAYDFQHVFISDRLVDMCTLSAKSKESTYTFPLYVYPENSTQQTLDGSIERRPNLEKKIVDKIAKNLDLKFSPEKKETEGTFAPIDLLDYIYAVLHSPSYRERYKEFLKIDFPRVPYPEDPELFWQLVELGGELRQIHLLEHPMVEEFITTYPIAGNNVISNRLTKTDPGFIPEDDDETIGKVWINEEQYFGNVPKKAWEFYIGGYQPADKWLKDRRDRELSIDEIRHYQKIIVALMETDRLMQEIDGVLKA